MLNKNLDRTFSDGLATWLMILVAVLIIIGGLTGYFLVFYKSQPEPESLTSKGTTTITDNKNESLKYDYEPGSVTVLQGTIKEIKDKILTITISADERNPALKGKFFDVGVDEQTKILPLEMPFYLEKKKGQTELFFGNPSIGEKTTKPKDQDLSFADLKSGDSVLVLSIEDFTNKDSFVAKAVYKK